MSDDKQEMVTLTYEIPLATAKLIRDCSTASESHGSAEQAAVIKALDARKSKYERWREGRGFPWSVKSFSGTMDVARRTCIRDVDGLISNRANTTMPDIELMAAAPQLLEALIDAQRDLAQAYPSQEPYCGSVATAIRAALPKDVADEVLGTKEHVHERGID